MSHTYTTLLVMACKLYFEYTELYIADIYYYYFNHSIFLCLVLSAVEITFG